VNKANLLPSSSLTRMELVLQEIQIIQHRQHVITGSLSACLSDTRNQLIVNRDSAIRSQADIIAVLEALQTTIARLPPYWLQSISNQSATAINNFQPHLPEGPPSTVAERQSALNRMDPGGHCHFEAQGSNTAAPPHRTHKQESFTVIPSPLKHSTLVFKLKLGQSQCSISCICRCPASVSPRRPLTRLPKVLRMITGSMLFEYSSCPASIVACDLSSCYRTRSTRLTLRYGFSLWPLRYAIHIFVEKLSTNNLTFTLALRRCIPYTRSKDNILYQARKGNLTAIKRIANDSPAAVLDVDYDGNSALHTSTKTFNPWQVSLQICKALLQAGEDPDQINADGLTFRHYICHLILQHAIPPKFHSEVERLIQVSQCLEDLELSFIHDIVVKRCPIDLAPVLKTGRADIVSQINAQDRFGMTPLMYAVALGDTKGVDVLIKAGASVHKTTPFGHTVLYYASSLPPSTCATLLDLLLAAGANAHAAFPSGWSVLLTAAIFDNTTMMHRIIQEGVSPDYFGPRGNRPIHYAASENSEKVVRLLHREGVDLNVLADNGLSPLGVAIQANMPDTQLALLELGADYLVTGEWGTIFHLAAYWGNEVTIRTLSSVKLQGLKIHARNAKGLTATSLFEDRYDMTDQLAIAFRQLKDPIRSQSLEEHKGEDEVGDDDIFFDASEV
jgi:ankyrin repeat protein